MWVSAVLLVVGAVLLLAGVACWSVPAAMVVAGIGLVVAALAREVRS